MEIVTGEVVDIIYQIKPIEFFGDHYWVKDYRKKADDNAKIIIDTIIRNTTIGDKMISHYQKSQKISLEDAIKKLEDLTPLAKNPKSRSATALQQQQKPAASLSAPASPTQLEQPVPPSIPATVAVWREAVPPYPLQEVELATQRLMVLSTLHSRQRDSRLVLSKELRYGVLWIHQVN